MRFDTDDGFTLVELAVVLAIVGILMTVGIASYSAMTRIADDKGTQLDLLTATKVEALHYLEHEVFADDPAVLKPLEPTLEFSVAGDPAGSIVVVIEPGRDAIDVCLFARTERGNWFSVHHSAAEGDHFGTSEPVACTPAEVGGWGGEW